MRLAITADLHLTTETGHPERYDTLRNLLHQCEALAVDRLVIAGDLFDRTRQKFADFEAVLKEARPKELEVLILPGNHDPDLSPGSFALSGVSVISEPVLLEEANEFQLLLLPYKDDSSMGQQLSLFREQILPGRWGLVAHGDWVGGMREPTPDEPGIYMPLTQADLTVFKPAFCLLGHIHQPVSDPPIYYAGSPCPLNVTETGPRRLLLLESDDQSIRSVFVESPRIFFDEKVVMLPVEDEAHYLEQRIREMVDRWNVPDSYKGQVHLRLKLTGFATDRGALEKLARKKLDSYTFYPGSPDVSDLGLTKDPDRNEIARRVEQYISQMPFDHGALDPDNQEILEAALGVIYGI